MVEFIRVRFGEKLIEDFGSVDSAIHRMIDTFWAGSSTSQMVVDYDNGVVYTLIPIIESGLMEDKFKAYEDVGYKIVGIEA